MFSYPGGKHRLKKRITKIISNFYGGERDIFSNSFDYIYAEPFLGSGQVLLELLNNIKLDSVFLNDIDIGLSSLWISVIKYCDELCEYLNSFSPSVETFYELKNFFRNKIEIGNEKEMIIIGGNKLALHQISYSGLGAMSGGPLGGRDQESEYKVDCKWNISNILKKVKKSHFLLRNIVLDNTCYSLDFEQVFDKLRDKRVFYYLDPPYYEKGEELYLHGFGEQDHRRLSSCLSRNPNPWLLSYDYHPEIIALYHWAFIKEIDVNYCIKVPTTKKELLIVPKQFAYILERE